MKELKLKGRSDDRIYYAWDGQTWGDLAATDERDAADGLFELALPSGESVGVLLSFQGDWEVSLALPESTRLAATFDEEATERWPRLLRMEPQPAASAMIKPGKPSESASGQLVRLKSGGPVMVTGDGGESGQYPTIDCWWWSGRRPRSALVATAALQPATAAIPRLNAEKAGLLTIKAAELHGEWLDAGMELDDIDWLLDGLRADTSSAHADPAIQRKRRAFAELTAALLEALAP